MSDGIDLLVRSISTVNLFGLDSTSEVSPAAHHAVGSKFSERYLSRYTSKVVTRQELVDADRNGLYLGLVFEDSATNALGGYAQGKADAEFAKKQALGILGQPLSADAMLPLAVDFDGTWDQVKDYFEGAAAVVGRNVTGPYGSYGVCMGAYAAGFRGLWQTYAWSGGRFAPGSKVYQYSNDHTVGGVGVDFDKCFDLSAFWNYRPAPSDPHHYLWFDTGPFKWGGFAHMNERAIVERYDVLRAEQTLTRHPHRVDLHLLRQQMSALAARLIWEARVNDPIIMPATFGRPTMPSWGKFHRGWRLQQLLPRIHGKRVV